MFLSNRLFSKLILICHCLFLVAAEQEAGILHGMRKLESLAAINNTRCVQFRPKVSSDVYYITIVNGVGCSSMVSKIPHVVYVLF